MALSLKVGVRKQEEHGVDGDIKTGPATCKSNEMNHFAQDFVS